MFKPKGTVGLPSLNTPKTNVTPPPVRVGKGKVKLKKALPRKPKAIPQIRGLGGLGGVPNPGSPMGGF